MSANSLLRNDSYTTEQGDDRFQTVLDYFHRFNAEFSVIAGERGNLVCAKVVGLNGVYEFRVGLHQLDTIIVYVDIPAPVQPKARGDMAKFVCLANFGLMVGKFELDMFDGELRFTGCNSFEGTRLEFSMIENLVGRCVWTADRYFPAILKVVTSGFDPVNAIFEIEPSQARANVLARPAEETEMETSSHSL